MSIIVTLTSTSERLTVLKYTLLSLSEQELKPDHIYLCISKDAYLIDKGLRQIPAWLEKLVAEGDVEIKWVKNTGPYRKLIPVFEAASEDDLIITCDDDVIYGPQWLSSLVASSKEHPDAIVCGRARRILRTPWGGFQSYINWPVAKPGETGKDLVPTGISGVVYKKHLLDTAMMMSNDYLELAPKQDDMWFHAARQRLGVNVVVSPNTSSHVFPVEAPGALSTTNAVTEISGWNSFLSALTDRVFMRIKAVIGMSVCGNDVAFKRVWKYSVKNKSV